MIADESHITGVLNTFKLEISEPARGTSNSNISGVLNTFKLEMPKRAGHGEQQTSTTLHMPFPHTLTCFCSHRPLLKQVARMLLLSRTNRCSYLLPLLPRTVHLFAPFDCCSNPLPTSWYLHQQVLQPAAAAPTRCPLMPTIAPTCCPPPSICCPLNRRVPHSRKFVGVFMGSNHGKAETSLVSVACSDCALRRWRRQQ